MTWRVPERAIRRWLTATTPLLLAALVFVLLEAGTSNAHDVPPEGVARAGVWKVLVTASVFAWAVLAGMGRRMARDVRGLSGTTQALDRGPIRAFVATVLVAVALPLVAAGLTGIGNEEVLDRQHIKNGLLHVMGGVLVVPLLVAIKRIQLFAADASAWSTTVDTLSTIRRIRRILHLATAALGGIVASAVVATGALRDAVAAADLTPTPDTFVLVYGAWYTAVLGAIYYYAFAAIEERARWFLETAAPLPEPHPEASEAFATTFALREQLTHELELGRSAFANVQGLVVILSPLLGAVFTRLGGI